MRVSPFCVGVLAALVLPAAAQPAEPEIRQFDIATLEKLGHDIYDQDQAAWHGTDALLALHPQAQLVQEKVRGWIVEKDAAGTLIRFIREGADGPETAYDIRYAPGSDYAHEKPVIDVPQDRHLSDTENAQFSARTLAIKSVTQRCGDNYNTVVLKDPESEGWLAWALASTTNPALVMVGGHLRLTISADGKTVLRRDALSRTCLIMNKKDPPQGKLAALFATQIVSDIPVETAVFLSLEHHLPIDIGTANGKTWEVKDGKIRAIK